MPLLFLPLNLAPSTHTTPVSNYTLLSSSVLFVRCHGDFKDTGICWWGFGAERRKSIICTLKRPWTLSYNISILYNYTVYSSVWESPSIHWSFTVSSVYGASLCPNRLRGQWEIWHLRSDMVIMMLTMPGLKSVLVILHIPCQVCLWLPKTLCLYSNNNIFLWPTWNRKVSLLQFNFQQLCKSLGFFMACKTDTKRALQALWLTPPPPSATAFIISICCESKHRILGKENGSRAFIGFTAGKAISTLVCTIMQTINSVKCAQQQCWFSYRRHAVFKQTKYIKYTVTCSHILYFLILWNEDYTYWE